MTLLRPLMLYFVSGCLSKNDALRLRGRMQFAAGQIFGRVAKKVLADVAFHAYAATSSKLPTEVLTSLAFYKTLLRVDVPRELRAGNDKLYLIFSDALFEPEHPSWQAGIGAVLCASTGSSIHFFSEHIEAECRKTMIFQVEFFAIWCCLRTWSRLLLGSQVMIYIDNGVRDCIISCQADSLNGRPILDACLRVEFDLRSNFWYARVPTDCNIADWQSRNELEKLHEFQCSRDRFEPALLLDAMVTYNEVGGG